MDQYNHDNSIKKYDEKSLEKLQSRVIFTDPAYLFVFKKTEKIVAAIYLVTNLISDTEPVKNNLRKTALDLMSDMSVVKKLPVSQTRQLVVGLMTTVSEIVSVLKIAFIAEHVSSMNYSIIHSELVALMNNLDVLRPENILNGSLLLSQDFFNTPAPVFQTNKPATNYINQHQFPSKGQYRTSNNLKDNQYPQPPKDNLKDTKSERRETIIKLLKVGKPLGIKDFSNEIKNCSEKTLQRELLAMVENGVLKKTGERRWSLYSLA